MPSFERSILYNGTICLLWTLSYVHNKLCHHLKKENLTNKNVDIITHI